MSTAKSDRGNNPDATMPGPRVAMMQPTFLPWQGYFALVANADKFIFLDDFQFSRRSYHQRNRIFTGPGSISWTTVPVEHMGDRSCALNEVRPMLDAKYRRQITACLRHSYGKTAYFDLIYPKIEGWLGRDWENLAAFNIAFIRMAAEWLGLSPHFHLSSQYPSPEKRSFRLAVLLRNFEAGSYISALGSFEYMAEDAVFPLTDINTYFQQFEPVSYPQLKSEKFVSHLSVLDALFQVGPDETHRLIKSGQKNFVPWNEMKETQKV